MTTITTIAAYWRSEAGRELTRAMEAELERQMARSPSWFLLKNRPCMTGEQPACSASPPTGECRDYLEVQVLT